MSFSTIPDGKKVKHFVGPSNEEVNRRLEAIDAEERENRLSYEENQKRLRSMPQGPPNENPAQWLARINRGGGAPESVEHQPGIIPVANVFAESQQKAYDARLKKFKELFGDDNYMPDEYFKSPR